MNANRHHWQRGLFALTAAITLLAGILPLQAEEGMWTLDNLPLKQLREKYGFVPTPQWLEHVRLASVRVGDGGSGSFISPNGLMLTNHHVALGQLQKVSTAEKNYVNDGFYAATTADELPCPDLELNVLLAMENVTARVMKAVVPAMTPAKALEARKAEIARIERESLKKTGLRSDVVTLYQGGEYWLYRYKKYTEVKLVFAPEQQIAFYGGDPDNFTYPRYDLDMAIFRAYENGKPANTPHYLKWSAQGAGNGELVFVSGHPGSTNRLMTLAQLQTQRDFDYPFRLAYMERLLKVCRAYAAQGPEQARQAAGMIFGIENGVKVSKGEYDGLKAPGFLERKSREEAEFRQRVAANPEWQKAYGDAWDQIATAIEKVAPHRKEYNYRRVPGLRLGGIALSVVRLAAEIKKPDGLRLAGFHEAELESTKFRLFSPAPVYPGLEEAMMVDTFESMIAELGAEDPFVKIALAGKTPAGRAKELISGTRLADPGERQKLFASGEKGIASSTDPLVVMARELDPLLRQMQKEQEEQIESIARPAAEKIGQARFAVYGKESYPDATFTLRLSYGTVKGYAMNGTLAPAKTTFYGLYDRALSFDNHPPFHLPRRYLESKDKIDLSTPLDFVATCDIIGGNSGSPVINQQGELVGLVFDGNIESLVGRFVYDDTANRTVAVHSSGMMHAMKVIYGVDALVKEILGQ